MFVFTDRMCDCIKIIFIRLRDRIVAVCLLTLRETVLIYYFCNVILALYFLTVRVNVLNNYLYGNMTKL